MNRTAETSRNVAWAVFSRIVTTVGPFVVRTFLIQRLGVEYTGLNGLFTSVLQVLNLAELGFSSAVVYSMYAPVAEGDERRVGELLNYFRRVYRAIGAVVLAAGLCLMPFLDAFVEGGAPEGVTLQGAFAVYLANTVLSYLLFAYKQSLLNAYLRNDVVNKAYVAAMAAQYAAQVLVLLAFPNFYLYAVMLPLSAVLNNLLTAWLAHRLFPQYDERRIRGLRLGAESRADIRRRVAGLMVSRVCQTTRDSLDSIIISTFLGLATVGVYNNYFMVISGVSGVLSTVTNAIGPSIGNSVATEDVEKNYADLRLFTFAYAMVSGVCASCLVSLYQPFMRVWVGESLMLPFSIPVLLSAYFYVRTMGDVRTLYVNATGIWWELRWRSIAEAACNVALNLVLVQLIGLPGVVLGTLLSVFFVNFLYGSHLVFKFYFGSGRALPFYLDHLLYMAAVAAVSAVCLLVTGLIPEGGVALLLVRAAAAFALSALLLAGLFARGERMRGAVGLARRVLSFRHHR